MLFTLTRRVLVRQSSSRYTLTLSTFSAITSVGTRLEGFLRTTVPCQQNFLLHYKIDLFFERVSLILLLKCVLKACHYASKTNYCEEMPPQQTNVERSTYACEINLSVSHSSFLWLTIVALIHR